MCCIWAALPHATCCSRCAVLLLWGATSVLALLYLHYYADTAGLTRLYAHFSTHTLLYKLDPQRNDLQCFQKRWVPALGHGNHEQRSTLPKETTLTLGSGLPASSRASAATAACAYAARRFC